MVLDTVVVLGQLNMFKLKDFVHYYVVIHATYIYILNKSLWRKKAKTNECSGVYLRFVIGSVSDFRRQSQENFKDAKGVIINRKSQKNRQQNG